MISLVSKPILITRYMCNGWIKEGKKIHFIHEFWILHLPVLLKLRVLDTWYLQKRIITGLLTGATNNDNFNDELNKNETYIVWIDVCPDQESETSNGRDAGIVQLPLV